MAKKTKQPTAEEQSRWPSLTCNGCVAETRGDALNVDRLRQTRRHQGWVHDYSTSQDWCPVCVKMGLHQEADPNHLPGKQ